MSVYNLLVIAVTLFIKIVQSLFINMINLFLGLNCETNIDDCITRPCRNNGTCIDGINTFHCQCEPGTFKPLAINFVPHQLPHTGGDAVNDTNTPGPTTQDN